MYDLCGLRVEPPIPDPERDPADLLRRGADHAAAADADLLASATAPAPFVSDEIDPTGFSPFFDIPSGPTTPFVLGPGNRINAEISVAGDTDWFRMELVQGQTYQITMTALPFFGLSDPALYLFDGDANRLRIDWDLDGDGTALATITATRTGTYFVGATGFGDGSAQSTGAYEIALARVDVNADTVGGTRATAGTAAVGETVTGSIDYIGDSDLYAVELEAGRLYAASVTGSFTGFGPLYDPTVEVIDADRNPIAFNNDNGVTRDAYATFEVPESGTYYVRAGAFGTSTGNFELRVLDLSPPEPPGPLDGLDWGVKLADPHVTYYFAAEGETFGNETTDSPWTDYEKQQAAAALREYSKFSLLTFEEVSRPGAADFKLTKNFLDEDNTGRMIPPDPTFGDSQGVGWFNTNPVYWSDEQGGLLERGAYGYSNFVHEFGHGLGLSHPHDDGGTSSVFAGVSGSFDSIGEFGLNQEVFTVMSYNKGWAFGPPGDSDTLKYGIARGPSAFDIAVIQQKYGANTDTATGDDTYTLFTENRRGTGYETIWDAGGRDRIVHDGEANAIIDLRPATLGLEEGGGGFVSWVSGTFGGFTIAAGVEIEGAQGGSGSDFITGNDGKNTLIGGKGGDAILGRGGKDKILGGGGKDGLVGEAGKDVLKGGGGGDGLDGGKGRDRLIGGSGDDELTGGAGKDKLIGGGGADTLTGGGGADTFVLRAGNGEDLIEDFNPNKDRLDLRAFDLADKGAVRGLAEETKDGLALDTPGKGATVLADLTLADFGDLDLIL